MKHPRSHIVAALFIRHPVPGRVKTRLACDLGEAAACELYRAMVTDIISSIQSSGLPLYLFHDGPAAAGLPLEWVTAAEDAIRQTGDSLGERMAAAFEYLFSIDHERVILTGSDIPGIDAPLLQAAVAALEKADVVLSPAFDGGYCLVAARKGRFNDSIFRTIPWSTSRVLEATLAACRFDNLTYALLDPCRDIDTLDDVTAYCRQASPTALATNQWLTAHGYPLYPPMD